LFLPQVTGLGGTVLLSWIGQSYSQSLNRPRHFSTISGTEGAWQTPQHGGHVGQGESKV